MTPTQLYDELDQLVENKIYDPVFIVGPPGIGKSAVPNQVAEKHGLTMCDVRWGQLGPADARGVPVVDRESRTTEFYPPKMWPRVAPALIFLDEYNMATPVMMGLGQQLILDRRFGDYVVPEGVFIWAAGNRKEDRASVNEMPAPVKNRFAHYEVEPEIESWSIWAFSRGIDPNIIGFLRWRPEQLHKFNPDAEFNAFPSPRTWEMADRRFKAGMDIDPVVGPVADEFRAYIKMASVLPSIGAIAEGKDQQSKWPVEEPSMQYAMISALEQYAIKDWPIYENCFKWLTSKAGDTPEWIQAFVMDVIKILERTDRKKNVVYMHKLNQMPEANAYIRAYTQSIMATRG